METSLHDTGKEYYTNLPVVKETLPEKPKAMEQERGYIDALKGFFNGSKTKISEKTLGNRSENAQISHKSSATLGVNKNNFNLSTTRILKVKKEYRLVPDVQASYRHFINSQRSRLRRNLPIPLTVHIDRKNGSLKHLLCQPSNLRGTSPYNLHQHRRQSD